MNEQDRRRRKRALIVGLVVPVALIHFVTGDRYNGPYPEFVNGYLLDMLLPMSLYFLLCLANVPALRSWLVKAALVFVAASAVEMAQFFGVPLLGRTFDPTDFFMYAAGVLLAALLDTVVFPRIFGFWTEEPEGTPALERPG
ncbi:hypothetical protein ACFLWA_09070 [Chloroflexota bacterium]